MHYTKYTKQEILEFTQDFFYMLEFGSQQDQSDCLLIVAYLEKRFGMSTERVIQAIYILEKMAKN